MRLHKEKFACCSWWNDHWAINDELGNEVATIDSYLPDAQQAALADLFCAAPELLESLKDLEIILSGKPYSRDEQKLLELARAAIAKAEGSR